VHVVAYEHYFYLAHILYVYIPIEDKIFYQYGTTISFKNTVKNIFFLSPIHKTTGGHVPWCPTTPTIPVEITKLHFTSVPQLE
jgi:hypothetical protein